MKYFLVFSASSAGALWRMMAADEKQKGGFDVKKRIESAEGEAALQLLMKVADIRLSSLLYE